MCLRCRRIIAYSFAKCWYECACRVWATDETIERGQS